MGTKICSLWPETRVIYLDWQILDHVHILGERGWKVSFRNVLFHFLLLKQSITNWVTYEAWMFEMQHLYLAWFSVLEGILQWLGVSDRRQCSINSSTISSSYKATVLTPQPSGHFNLNYSPKVPPANTVVELSFYLLNVSQWRLNFYVYSDEDSKSDANQSK